jgi:hypothetical protein
MMYHRGPYLENYVTFEGKDLEENPHVKGAPAVSCLASIGGPGSSSIFFG